METVNGGSGTLGWRQQTKSSDDMATCVSISEVGGGIRSVTYGFRVYVCVHGAHIWA